MPKKELPTTIRPMQGFETLHRVTQRPAVLDRDIQKTEVIVAHNVMPPGQSKDAIIAELRASLAQLQAADKARRAKQRERTKKSRGGTGTDKGTG